MNIFSKLNKKYRKEIMFPEYVFWCCNLYVVCEIAKNREVTLHCVFIHFKSLK